MQKMVMQTTVAEAEQVYAGRHLIVLMSLQFFTWFVFHSDLLINALLLYMMATLKGVSVQGLTDMLYHLKAFVHLLCLFRFFKCFTLV